MPYQMSPRQRIANALNHEYSDRIPLGFDATPETTSNLIDFLGLKDKEQLLQRLGCDFRVVFPKYTGPKNLKSFDDFYEGKDVFGVERKMVKNKFGNYFEMINPPMKGFTNVEQVINYDWPKVEWFDFESLNNQVETINYRTEYWICLISTGVFEQSWYMRGFDQFLMDLIINPEIAKAIMDRVYQFVLDITVLSIKASKGKIDMIMTGDDLGAQDRILISADLYRNILKPYLISFCDVYHSYGTKVCYHSCGSIGSLIEDLIDAGIDVLNPLQFRAKDFPDPKLLKSLYGSKLCFLGGMDTQDIFPFATAGEIKKETIYLIESLGKKGGYILQTSHAIQPDTSPEKIVTFYDTAINYEYSGLNKV